MRSRNDLEIAGNRIGPGGGGMPAPIGFAGFTLQTQYIRCLAARPFYSKFFLYNEVGLRGSTHDPLFSCHSP